MFAVIEHWFSMAIANLYIDIILVYACVCVQKSCLLTEKILRCDVPFNNVQRAKLMRCAATVTPKHVKNGVERKEAEWTMEA